MNSTKTSFDKNDTDSLDGTIVDDDKNDDLDSDESFHGIVGRVIRLKAMVSKCIYRNKEDASDLKNVETD